jgi:hypothetical protein
VYVKTYQNASTNWILRGEMEILKITQRQHNTHTETVLRDKFVKSYWIGCADFAGKIGGWCDNLAIRTERDERHRAGVQQRQRQRAWRVRHARDDHGGGAQGQGDA